ncbi:MAG: DUF2752 domain-containing protein [Cyanobacteria bacterium P01_E01_bin.35]
MSAKKIQLIAIYFLCSLGILILYYFNPADSNNIYPPSLSREWGEYYCPGCGMMRALHQLLHGNWQLALRLNPLLIICLPYFFYWIVPYFLRYFYQINLYTIKFKNQQIFIIAMIFTIYGFLRNVPSLWWLVPPA